ncbi:MAG TPA: hypothetical protein VIV61_11035, partial [Candidatus Ozemobacteraceae bacterium]
MTPDPRPVSGADKLKATLMLGIGSNFSTMAGILAGWVILGRTGWIDGFWSQILFALLLAPIFMGDAINAYVLGRIRLDALHGWDDVQITDEGRRALGRMHFFWRTLSFLTAASLAALFLVSRSPEPVRFETVRVLFPALLFLHAARCFHTVHAYIAPRIPAFGGMALVKRFALAGGIGIPWVCWLTLRDVAPEAWWSMILHGIVYFLISGWLQPLPSKFSVFQPSGSGRRLPRLVVEPLRGGLAEPAVSGDVRREAERWQADHGFALLSDVRMPLLEMPLFEATGTALASADGRSVLLLLQSEVRPRPHRTLVSWIESKALVTTDFGATTARFPGGITYVSRPTGEAPAAFLAAHEAAVPA